ncbi:MAG: 3-isopropylmalate dehydratase small subunit [Clostridia bacterium]|nr:3-isopropylmalate dehydratase small subunit [Clostridia bacterium]
MNVHSSVIKYGDHVDTDVIIPARYLNTTDHAELASHCMEDIDADFKQKSRTRRVIVAGRNFGCGSSREHAPIAIKESGIELVIADSFARIFYRNAIDIGLPIIECPAAAAAIADGDEVDVDLDRGVITDVTTGESFTAAPFPPFIQEIISSGGIAAYVRKRMSYKKMS